MGEASSDDGEYDPQGKRQSAISPLGSKITPRRKNASCDRALRSSLNGVMSTYISSNISGAKSHSSARKNCSSFVQAGTGRLKRWERYSAHPASQARCCGEKPSGGGSAKNDSERNRYHSCRNCPRASLEVAFLFDHLGQLAEVGWAATDGVARRPWVRHQVMPPTTPGYV